MDNAFGDTGTTLLEWAMLANVPIPMLQSLQMKWENRTSQIRNCLGLGTRTVSFMARWNRKKKLGAFAPNVASILNVCERMRCERWVVGIGTGTVWCLIREPAFRMVTGNTPKSPNTAQTKPTLACSMETLNSTSLYCTVTGKPVGYLVITLVRFYRTAHITRGTLWTRDTLKPTLGHIVATLQVLISPPDRKVPGHFWPQWR